MKNLSEHWDTIYKKKPDEKLGWYEEEFSKMTDFLHLVPDWDSANIFVPGIGTSGFVDILSKTKGKLFLNDISKEALAKAKGKHHGDGRNIQWLCQDICEELRIEEKIDIWIDRAVLHFLVEEIKIQGYFRNLTRVVRNGGYVIFAEFSKKGADSCAGLKVKRYDIDDFQKHLGDFDLLRSEELDYTNPSGDSRPYIYAMFKRKERNAV